MSAEFAIVLALGIFVVCVLMEVQIGLALALAGAVGVGLTRGLDVAVSVVASVPYSSSSSYALFTIPMFILLGSLIAHTGIGLQIFGAVNYFVRGIPGGLAASTAVAVGLFSGISGASSADVATFGRLSVDQMGGKGYDRNYASAVVASAATFALLIPPSIILLIYAIVAEQSPGAMLLAGLLPGMLSAGTLAIFVVARARITGRADLGAVEETVDVSSNGPRPAGALDPWPEGVSSPEDREDVPPADGAAGLVDDASLLSNLKSNSVGLLSAFVLFTVVLGGMYSGIFTATEAGAWGALAAFLIVLTGRVCPKDQRLTVIRRGLRETANVTSMIFLLIIGGSIFGFFAASVGLPRLVAEWAAGLDVGPALLLVIFLAIMFTMGTLLDSLSILLLAGPVVLPVVDSLGYDLMWFGVLMLKVIEIGLITPPVGMNIFIISGILKQRPERVFRFVWPFVLLDLMITAVLFLVPSITLWLPSNMG